MNNFNGKIIGNPLVTPMPKSDWSQNDERKANFVKNRTHYTETVLLCDYTPTSYGVTSFRLDKELDVDNVKLYINEEYVPTTMVEKNGYYSCHYTESRIIFDYYKSENTIVFLGITLGDNYKVYEEIAHQLDAKYIPKLTESHIPDTTLKMINQEKELVCRYVCDSADFTSEDYVAISVNRKLTKDNIAVYINGEKPVDLRIEDNVDGGFVVWWSGPKLRYMYAEDEICILTYIFETSQDGDVIEVYLENTNAIKEKDVPNSIARTQYVDGQINAKVGDIKAALLEIEAMADALIGGDA